MTPWQAGARGAPVAQPDRRQRRVPENPLALAIAASLLVLLAACADFSQVPAARARPVDGAAAGLPAHTDGAAAPAAPTTGASHAWWQALGDTRLDALMATALAGNPGLQVAQARVERAQAALAGTDAATRPQVSAALDLTRQRFTGNGLYPSPLAGSVRNSGTLQLNAGWELDFFGRHPAALDAALGGVRATQADAQAAAVLLASQVARSYVHLGRLHAQRQWVLQALDLRATQVRLARQRRAAGLDTEVDVLHVEASLPELRQTLQALDEQATLTRHALAALSGAPQQVAQLAPPTLDTLRPLAVPSAIPANWLGQRPDVAAARWRVEAAEAEATVAQTLFYPNLNLVAFAGLSSVGLDRLLRDTSAQLGVGPALRLPVFDAGRLRANLRGKRAEWDAAVHSYNATVFDAVRDVTDQLAVLASAQAQRAEQQHALQTATELLRLAHERRAAGLTSELPVLAAQLQQLNQQRLDTELDARVRDAQIALVRALGTLTPEAP